MKRFLLSFLLLCGLASGAIAQNFAGQQTSTFTSSGTAAVIDQTATGATAHTLSWTITGGTFLVCSLRLQGAADSGISSSVVEVITLRGCTSNGITTVVSDTRNYTRVQVVSLTAATGSPTLTVVHTYYGPVTSVTTEELTARVINNVRYCDQFEGVDAGAKITAAIADLPIGGGTVDCRGLEGAQSAASTLTLSKPVHLLLGGGIVFSLLGNPGINITANGVVIEGPSANTQCSLRYAGINSGTAIQAATVTGFELANCTVQTGQGGTSVGVLLSGVVDAKLSNFVFNGLTETTGFHTPIRITGTSTIVKIVDGYINSFIGAGINADHTIELFLDNLSIWSTQNNTTYYGIILDAAISGVYGSNVSVLHGLNGLLVRDTNQGGAGNAPTDIFFSQSLFDTTTGGDAIKYDETLGASITRSAFTGCWAAGAGLNAAGTVVTAASHGFHITGGSAIKWTGGYIRANARNGVLIDDADVNRVSFDGAVIVANNYNANADAHGVYISAAISTITLTNNVIGNVVEVGGDQKYGLKIGAVSVTNLKVTDNDFTGNTTGAILNGNTGTGSQVIGPNIPTGTGGLGVAGGVADSIAVLQSNMGSYLLPNTGAGGSFRGGFGVNLYFDGTNWKTRNDGANNGASALLAANDGTLKFYTIPSTGASDQSISNANLTTNNEKASFDTNGRFSSTLFGSVANCIDSAGDAACGAAIAGSFVVDAADTTTVVATTAITANSQIILQVDSSLGTRLSVTCNTEDPGTFDARITARTAATNFTVTLDAGPTTNPLCLSYWIIN